MESAQRLLSIDEKQTAERIERYIRDAVNEHKMNGILMGVSGGVDSAVLVSLAVRALGRDRVHVYFLHDKNSESDSERKARLVAEKLGLKLNLGSIADRMREREKSAGFFKWMSGLPPFVPSMLASFYYVVMGETPYITVLRKNELKDNRFKSWIYENIMKGVEDMFDGPCEERRVFLSAIAERENLLLIGSGNRSEDLTGWFTVKGVDNMPVSPIATLYKTQVNQMGRFLGVPEEILRRPPSADVLRGATDTLTLGMDFEKIDVVLYGMENKLTDEELMGYGVKKSEIEKVREINRLSEWRRAADKNG